VTDAPADVHIVDVRKNARELLRIAIREFKGRRNVDLRTYFLGDDGAFLPTAKGVSIRPDLLSDVIAALQAAEAKSARGRASRMRTSSKLVGPDNFCDEAAVYSGLQHIGSVRCYRGRYRALSADGKRIGEFDRERDAAAAIVRADAERRSAELFGSAQ
jgi:hypothetical protein